MELRILNKHTTSEAIRFPTGCGKQSELVSNCEQLAATRRICDSTRQRLEDGSEESCKANQSNATAVADPQDPKQRVRDQRSSDSQQASSPCPPCAVISGFFDSPRFGSELVDTLSKVHLPKPDRVGVL